jgi:hypothetical protein
VGVGIENLSNQTRHWHKTNLKWKKPNRVATVDRKEHQSENNIRFSATKNCLEKPLFGLNHKINSNYKTKYITYFYFLQVLVCIFGPLNSKFNLVCLRLLKWKIRWHLLWQFFLSGNCLEMEGKQLKFLTTNWDICILFYVFFIFYSGSRILLFFVFHALIFISLFCLLNTVQIAFIEVITKIAQAACVVILLYFI